MHLAGINYEVIETAHAGDAKERAAKLGAGPQLVPAADAA